jgi:predicted kinase
MDKYLILLAGSPATGKSYLVNQIKQVLPDIFSITPDEIKEILADSVGFNNLAEKKELEKEVWKFYYQVLGLYMGIGKRFILSEYPFSDKQKQQLVELTTTYDYQVITIRLVSDFEKLWARRKLRDVQSDRHLSHISTHYHFGDQLENRALADDLITKEAFKKIIEERQYNHFSLVTLYEYDVSDFSKVDYTGLLQKLANLNT